MGKSPYAMQAKSFEKWPDATDEYGFSAFPASNYGSTYFGTEARFWSSTQYSTTAMFWLLDADKAYSTNSLMLYRFSVRCLKD